MAAGCWLPAAVAVAVEVAVVIAFGFVFAFSFAFITVDFALIFVFAFVCACARSLHAARVQLARVPWYVGKWVEIGECVGGWVGHA